MKLPKIFALMAISSLSPGVRSNELPDMPAPKTESVEAYKVREQQKPVHRFYASKETRITLAVELHHDERVRDQLQPSASRREVTWGRSRTSAVTAFTRG